MTIDITSPSERLGAYQRLQEKLREIGRVPVSRPMKPPAAIERKALDGVQISWTPGGDICVAEGPDGRRGYGYSEGEARRYLEGRRP